MSIDVVKTSYPSPEPCVLLPGLFQAALSLAVVLYQGLRLTQALEAAFGAMATACVQKQQDAAQEPATQTAAYQSLGLAPSSQGMLSHTCFTSADIVLMRVLKYTASFE